MPKSKKEPQAKSEDGKPAKPAKALAERPSDWDFELLTGAMEGDAAKCREAIANGASLDARTDGEQTALMLAIDHGDPKLAKALAKAMSPVQLGLRDGHGQSAIDYAVRTDDAKMVGMLAKMGVDVECAHKGCTSLMRAAMDSDVGAKVVEALLAAGADPLAVDEDGYSALALAISNDNEVGALALASVSARGRAPPGETILAMARDMDMLEVVRTLANADSAAVLDREGRRAIDRAIEDELGATRLELVEILSPFADPWAGPAGGAPPLVALVMENGDGGMDDGDIAKVLSGAVMASARSDADKLVFLSRVMGMAEHARSEDVAKVLKPLVAMLAERMELGAAVGQSGGLKRRKAGMGRL